MNISPGDQAMWKKRLFPDGFETQYDTFTSVTLEEIQMVMPLTLPNVFTWTMIKNTTLGVPFHEVYEYDYENNFKQQLPVTNTMWDQLQLRLYKVTDGGFQRNLPIESVTVQSLGTQITGGKSFSYERLQMMTQKNGLRRHMSNNNMLNNLCKNAVLIDATDLNMAQSAVICANSIVIQNWLIEVEPRAGFDTANCKVEIIRLVYGVGNLSEGVYSKEEGLFSATEVANISSDIGGSPMPISTHQAHGIAGGGIFNTIKKIGSFAWHGIKSLFGGDHPADTVVNAVKAGTQIRDAVKGPPKGGAVMNDMQPDIGAEDGKRRIKRARME